MRNKVIFSTATLAASLLAAPGIQAEEQMGSLGSHEHGVAELNVAMDGPFLEIELVSPAANIFGFEHEIRNAKQQAQVDSATAALKAADKLFSFTRSAECSLGRVELEYQQSKDEHGHEEHGHEKHDEHGHEEHGHEKHDEHGHDDHGHEKHDEHGHDDHGHEKHDEHGHDDHGHEKHDEHGHDDHAHEKHDESTHSDIRAQYFYQCAKPGKLLRMDTTLFQQFPAMEKINVQLITPQLQTGKILSKEKSSIYF